MLPKLHRIVVFLLIVTALASAHERRRHTHAARHHAARHHAAHKARVRQRPARRTRRAKRSTRRRASRRLVRRAASFGSLSGLTNALVQDPSPQNYRAVESYARSHEHEESGALAWLSVAYRHILDAQYPEALAALDKTRGHLAGLADCVRYFQAQAYSGEGDNAQVVRLLEGFERQMPHSIFRQDAAQLYGSALYTLGRTQEAIAFLSRYRRPFDPDIELTLGESYLHSDHPEKGMTILKHIYFTMPTSPQATAAAAQLTQAGSALIGGYDELRTRANLLAAAGQWDTAEQEYRALLNSAPASEIPGVQVSLAAALLQSGSDKEAGKLLQQTKATGEVNARRLYLLGEVARDASDSDALDANLAAMRQQAPGSPWLDRALRSAANFYLLGNDLEHAGALFAEEQRRFPHSKRAPYANWRAAWFAYRLGRRDLAVEGFEQQVRLYPRSPEVAGALYWRARIAEDEQDYHLARVWYRKLTRRYRNYYYAILGRERLASLPPTPQNVALSRASDPLLRAIPAVHAPDGDQLQLDPPPENTRAEKSRLLASAGLTDYAVRELKAVGGGRGAGWATFAIASIYEDSGDDFHALRFLKQAVPGYYALSLSSLPGAYWKLLFPLPYWHDLEHQATANSLDPYLVAALIRQESEFNPSAVSHANAYGLMQLLPRVGRGEARQVHLRHFHTSSLLDPKINLRLGTRYLKGIVSQYDGQVEYALAAYNAGTNRVDAWRQSGDYRDMPEFVESIPFSETRNYVQAIVRNARVYRRLYSPR